MSNIVYFVLVRKIVEQKKEANCNDNDQCILYVNVYF